MADFIHFRYPTSPEIDEALRKIPTCQGTCFFIDMVGSTAIKYQEDFISWGSRMNNTFNFISILNDFPDNVVKGIGDEIMIFIPDKELSEKSNYNDHYALLHEIYSTVFNIKNHPLQDKFLHCKVAIHYCTDVYNITFLEGVNDYYGKHIDLTARLTSRAQANHIVLSEAFYHKAKAEHNQKYSGHTASYLQGVSAKVSETFKGVPESVEYRILKV